MGLAANQARLLTLQSRMNDLELRCMQISNQKITNSIKSSNASIRYNNRLQEINNDPQYAAEYVTQSYTTSEGWRTVENSSTTLKMNQNGSKVSFNYNTLKEMGYEIAPKGSVANVTTTTAPSQNVGTTKRTENRTVTTPAVDAQGRKNVTEWQMPTTAAEFKKLLESAGLVDESTGSGNTASQGLSLNKWLNSNGDVVKSEEAGTVAKTNLKTLVAAFTKDGVASDDANATINFDRAKLAKLLGNNNAVEAPTVSKTNTKTTSVGSASKSIQAGSYDMPTTMNELMNLLQGLKVLGNAGSRSFQYEGGPLKEVNLKSNIAFQINGFNEVNTQNWYAMTDIAKMFAKNPSDVKDDFESNIEFDYNKLASIIGESDRIGAAQTTNSTSETVSERDYQGVTNYGETSTTTQVEVEVPVEEPGETTTTISYETNDVIEEAKNNSSKLIEGILAGNIGIYKDGQEVSLSEVGIETETTSNPTTESWGETSTVQTLDYTKRDNARAEAKNEYEGEVSRLSAEEKKLDLMSRTANTEYQAACTEYESVKSLISENSDRAFSIFG